MAITAFTSTAIIDATTIGTTVLTASSAGIAADAIGLGTTDDVTFNSVGGVDGDFSGTVTANTITSSGGNLTLQRNSSDSIIIGGAFIQCYQEVRPSITNTYSSGTATLRWSNTYSVDGSFTGNLVSETGGSYKLYDLGTEGDADTRYGEIYWSGNYLYFGSKTTGTGGGRDVGIARDGSAKIIFSTSTTTSYSRISPVSDGTISIGQTSKRWSNVYSVGGDFSGTVTMSGLPTSDPGVAGQLYTTTGGALKVSEG